MSDVNDDKKIKKTSKIKKATAYVTGLFVAVLLMLWVYKKSKRTAAEFAKTCLNTYGVDKVAAASLVADLSVQGMSPIELKKRVLSLLRATPIPDDERLHKLLEYVLQSTPWSIFKKLHNSRTREN